jgi:Cu2+-exporting ATPase
LIWINQPAPARAKFRSGVPLNSGDAIERLAVADRIVFDQTGTLTLPELNVTNSADVPRGVLNSPGGSRLPAIIPLPPRWRGQPGQGRLWRESKRRQDRVYAASSMDMSGSSVLVILNAMRAHRSAREFN